MKTILYNPIFINPQAYYVFPRLTRYLQPDNESTAEPANYIGTIEVKVIAYGDTTLKRTYTNTDSIDLSEFKNTWIRISLFTKVGSCVLGEWKIGNMESDLPYIDPEVLASLKAVVIVGNKTNNDSDRAIVKNLVDPDNPFVISNAAYTEGSGYADKDSPYYGAFVTDGIDDLITSTKTVQEMLGGSNEITVVSMIHQVKDSSNNVSFTNYIRGSANGYFRNIVNNYDKTGIYGYTSSDLMGLSVVNNILGDKNDYTSNGDNRDSIINGNFSVQGYSYNDGNNTGDFSSVAWYWTVIANKVLTTDQINQVIAYFNLDRTLNPDILCDVKKQGITNENHAEFGDKLIDFSGNGRDIQLNNLAWKGDSGIGKYNYPNWKVTATIANTYSTIVNYPTVNGTYSINVNGVSELMQSIGLHLEIKYTTSTGIIYNDIKQDGVYSYILPDGATDLTLRFGGIPGIVNEPCNITITQIPSHAGALCLDGVNDFGKVTGMPIYKDYTFIIDRQIISIGDTAGVVASKSEDSADATKHGAFIFEYLGAPDKISTWSFYKDNGQVANTDFTRGISYQSKYSYNGKDLTVGTSKDSDKLWLGTIRDRDSRFFNGAIYSLMSFPYSMNKFLIERQLKKHKLGTLYPNMVEFRPVIKSSVELASKPTFVIRGTSTLLNTGDYIPENSEIWVVITMNNAADRITKFVINGNTIDIPSSAYNPSTMKYGFPFTIDSKSPQKITITIEQDENYVKFEPVITSNVEYVRLDFYLNNYQKRINVGDYIPKDAYVRANFYLKNNVDELTVFTFNGVNIDYKRSVVDDTAFNIGAIYNYDSPQEVNITVDEYIRYEDIDFTNCYPGVPSIYVNDKSVTWGDKLKVGDEFTFYGNVNILPEMYNVLVKALYNGEEMVYGSIGTISKSMVFTSFKTYIFDDNEPKCILSPRLLRIPNSSYKILGHIPDISGHGNHGKINNSAYAKMSGANGYKQDFTSWRTNGSGYSIVTDSKYILTNEKAITNGGYFLWNRLAKDSFKVKISNIPNGGWMSYRYKITEEDTQFSSLFIREDGIYTLPATIADSEVDFFISTVSAPAKDWIGLTIEQIGEYEGAYCLDGVDDFVTIPTLSSGGKQVLMKVNWNTINSIIYDQRGSGGFAIYCSDYNNPSDSITVPAYKGRNAAGTTYIDGIRNEYIIASQLRNVTHNIVEILDTSYAAGNINPIIGKSYMNSNYGSLALYDFMLFDNISTDDKIKELNEYVGIEAKVELPPYYYDAYGKTNLDEDKATIQQRGVAIGDYDLINNNFAYEGMSGYNGYPAVFGTNKTYANLVPNDGNFILTSSHNIINVTKFDTSYGLLYSHIKLDGKLTSRNIDYPSYKIKVTGLGENFGLHYSYLESSSDTTVKGFEINNDGIYIIPKSFASDGSLTSNSDWIGFIFTGTAPESCNVTIEVLPEYENGLVYDGVTDYSENVNIPAFTDYTYIFKRTLLNKKYNSASVFKGSNQQSGGGAFICDYNSVEPELMIQGYSFGAGLYANSLNTNDIVYGTKNSVNGAIIAPGNNADVEGLAVGKWRAYRQMVFYKLILYPKTISLLQINFLKNLMERDEIIDLTNPIFIQE